MQTTPAFLNQQQIISMFDQTSQSYSSKYNSLSNIPYVEEGAPISKRILLELPQTKRDQSLKPSQSERSQVSVYLIFDELKRTSLSYSQSQCSNKGSESPFMLEAYWLIEDQCIDTLKSGQNLSTSSRDKTIDGIYKLQKHYFHKVNRDDDYRKMSNTMRENQYQSVLLEEKLFRLEDELSIERKKNEQLSQQLQQANLTLLRRQSDQKYKQLQDEKNNLINTNKRLNDQLSDLMKKQRLLFEESSSHYDEALNAKLQVQSLEMKVKQLEQDLKRKVTNLERTIAKLSQQHPESIKSLNSPRKNNEQLCQTSNSIQFTETSNSPNKLQKLNSIMFDMIRDTSPSKTDSMCLTPINSSNPNTERSYKSFRGMNKQN